MNTSYNIAELTRVNALSGATYAAYQLGRELLTDYLSQTRPGYSNVQVREPAEAEVGGLFGLPIWNTLHFGELEAGPRTYSLRGRTYSLPELTLPAVLMTITGSKAIVKTELTGTRKIGSVKEMMGYNDYQVRVSGILYDPNRIDRYPIELVNKLRLICEAPIAVPIVNDLLNRTGIMDVVIEEWSLPPYPGKENLQPFELTMVSDEPVELVIEDRQALLRDYRT